ncbi:hypothetical protein C4D60_Mb05t28480 [Musa balbisiana]|uniref:Uncharacterized protein n=1 Tax=Musa balbisiana TaxID=52838 RepID=A0A4S8JZN1_MUSBA|nr:hypothetical protein C4D60_Mb05t28480 [Musa balbisiana]
MEIVGPSNVVLLRLGGSCQCSSDDLVLRIDHLRAVALIIEEMGCKPPHIATDKIDIDQVWKSFHCVHPLGRTVKKLYAGEEPLTIIERDSI